jgi:outer membrane immunogenic protein
MPIRKPTAAIVASVAVISTLPAKADALIDAMKRIAELEAKNIALEVNQRRLEQENSAIAASKVKLEESLKHKEAHAVVATRKPEKVTSLSAHEAAPPVQPIQQETQKLEEISRLSFEGAYIGINGGYGGGDIAGNNRAYALDISSPTPWFIAYFQGAGNSHYGGPLVGGQIGYNIITKSHILLGAEIDADWADISSKGSGKNSVFYSSLFLSTGRSRSGLDWIGTARGRLGYNLNSAIAYITGGLAFGVNSNSSAQYSGSVGPGYWNGSYGDSYSSKFSAGWVAGAGIEHALANNISIKTEYLYTQISAAGFNPSSLQATVYSSARYSGLIQNQSYSNYDPLGFHQVRFGVNYHPHWFETPAVVAAKY